MKILLNVFLIFVVSSCLNFKGEEGSIDGVSSNAKSKTTKVEDILKTFKGGTVDIRNSNVFKVLGSNDQKKLLETQITLLGNGKVIISSDKALAFKGDGKKIILGPRNFSHFVVEEHRSGKIIKSTIKNSSNGLEYRLKL
tara:strand:+ start:12157 stop:12576 length:420 start_codon:yes stop_codon:yes gene_type:complete